MTRLIRNTLCSLLLFSLVVSMVSCQDGEKYTSDIVDYNTEDYPVYSPLPKKIPENADVVKFVWYDYYHEKEEVYLELRFDTIADFDTFLENILEYAQSSLQEYNPSIYDGDEWRTIQSNPYDRDFTDCFVWGRGVYTGDSNYVGYEIAHCGVKVDYHYKCYYDIITYSSKDLTVIISSVSGTFHQFEKIPEYLKRFKVEEKPVDRMILIRSRLSNKMP